MRIWSLHPEYLDGIGLVALWRESLLAKKVLEGKTRGYTLHPQLDRFKSAHNPLISINYYLKFVFEESQRRGYSFDSKKFIDYEYPETIEISRGQLEYEFEFLKSKIRGRSPEWHPLVNNVTKIKLHPLFSLVEGAIAPWEKIK